MSTTLETARLRLRPLTLGDTAFVIELLNSPGWLRYIGDRNVRTEAEAIAYLEKGPLKSYHERGFGLSLVERKEDGKALGMCGIIWRDYLEHPDIGFAFLPEYQGQGYAYEMASVTLAHAREALQIPIVSAITLEENERSVRLLEKIGLRYAERIRLPNDDEELLLYRSA